MLPRGSHRVLHVDPWARELHFSETQRLIPPGNPFWAGFQQQVNTGGGNENEKEWTRRTECILEPFAMPGRGGGPGPGAPDGQYVVIQYETSFERKSSAIETITPIREKDGKWRVAGYYIR